MTQMTALFSFQEQVKIDPRDKTLHEQMCFIADDVVRYNFSDVAVHDARILERMKKGETRLWIISELGSQFLPMYCKLGEAKKQQDKEYALSSVEIAIARLLNPDSFEKLRSRQFLSTAQFYFITKKSKTRDGVIFPISFKDVVDFVYMGEANCLVS